jgi:hypothetical protein
MESPKSRTKHKSKYRIAIIGCTQCATISARLRWVSSVALAERRRLGMLTLVQLGSRSAGFDSALVAHGAFPAPPLLTHCWCYGPRICHSPKPLQLGTTSFQWSFALLQRRARGGLPCWKPFCAPAAGLQGTRLPRRCSGGGAPGEFTY